MNHQYSYTYFVVEVVEGVGETVGVFGEAVGDLVGEVVGDLVGEAVGDFVGEAVGDLVGEVVW